MKKEKIALFPGSFDPITLGHYDIIQRGLPLFDKIIIGVGVNSEKKYMFSLEQRLEWLEKTFVNEDKISVKTYEGLTVNFAKEIEASCILRGLRNPSDFEFEKAIAHTNRQLQSELETVFLLTSSGKSFISSSIVRDVIGHNGDYTTLVPNTVRV